MSLQIPDISTNVQAIFGYLGIRIFKTTFYSQLSKVTDRDERDTTAIGTSARLGIISDTFSESGERADQSSTHAPS